MSAEAIVRGEGLRPYQRRKAPHAMVLPTGWWEDDMVLVIRTHDLDEADRLAMHVWYRDVGDPVQFPVGKPCWMRLVPWDASGHGYDSTWIDADPTDRRAVPAVEYRWDAS